MNSFLNLFGQNWKFGNLEHPREAADANDFESLRIFWKIVDLSGKNQGHYDDKIG